MAAREGDLLRVLIAVRQPTSTAAAAELADPLLARPQVTAGVWRAGKGGGVGVGAPAANHCASKQSIEWNVADFSTPGQIDGRQSICVAPKKKKKSQ